MKVFSLKQLLLPAVVVILTACGNLSKEVENKLNELQDKTGALDSLINKEVDKVLSLDSIIQNETEKVKKLDSLINKSTSKLDSVANAKIKRLKIN